jgi:hypothetical protein
MELKMSIQPEISRSWLLVNSLKADQLDAISESRADQIVIDIEDATPWSIGCKPVQLGCE